MNTRQKRRQAWRHGEPAKPEWHADVLLKREIGDDWRRQYHAAQQHSDDQDGHIPDEQPDEEPPDDDLESVRRADRDQGTEDHRVH